MSIAPSPTLNISTIVSFTIKINGTPINDTVMLTSIKVTHEINKISFADIVLNTTTGNANDYSFLHGNTVEINLGYQGFDEKQIFSGIIVKHSMSIESLFVFIWELKCKHQSVLMTGAKKKKTIPSYSVYSLFCSTLLC